MTGIEWYLDKKHEETPGVNRNPTTCPSLPGAGAPLTMKPTNFQGTPAIKSPAPLFNKCRIRLEMAWNFWVANEAWFFQYLLLTVINSYTLSISFNTCPKKSTRKAMNRQLLHLWKVPAEALKRHLCWKALDQTKLIQTARSLGFDLSGS